MRNEAQYLKSVEENPNSNKEAARIVVRLANLLQGGIRIQTMINKNLDSDPEFSSVFKDVKNLYEAGLGTIERPERIT